MYQVYRLIRMINATYPNNRFINERDIDETKEVSEDLLDVINEALHESYKEVELDEVYSFPTNTGQAEYMLPDDCDLSQIQEVTRSFPRIHHHGHIRPIEDLDDEDRPDIEHSDNDYGDEPGDSNTATLTFINPSQYVNMKDKEGNVKTIITVKATIGSVITEDLIPTIEPQEINHHWNPEIIVNETKITGNMQFELVVYSPNPGFDDVAMSTSLNDEVEIKKANKISDYYNGGLYPEEHYRELPEGVGVHYYTQIPRHNPFIGTSRRLVFARDAECLTGDRYYNGWDSRRIGISPTPRTHSEIITIYYKKKPHDVRTKDDDIEIKDKYIHILKYNICAKLAMMGSNPDIEMANIFNRQYNDLLLEARREKDTDLPYYPHTKDNDRPSAFYRRFPRRHVRW